MVVHFQMTANKRNKAYKIASGKKWNVAIHEANVLQCIKLAHRIHFYDNILMKSVHEMDTDIRSSRRQTKERCDTPQTFDTAYSSMKQSVSPASLSPTLNDLDRNYDVDKNINNYLKSVELSRLEDLPHEDFQMDESASYTPITELPPSNDQIYCPLTKLVYDKLQEDAILSNQNIIANQSKFMLSMNDLWLEMMKTNRESSSKRQSRRLSTCTGDSNTSSNTPKQTKRQISLAYKKETIERQLQAAIAVEKDIEHQKMKHIETKEQRKLEKQKQQHETINNCCLKNHPANLLLKGLPKDSICQCCLGSGSLMKCAGKCNAHFHKDCLNKPISEKEYNTILKRKMKETIKAKKNGDEPNDDVTCNIVDNVEKIQCNVCVTLDADANTCFVCSKSDKNCVQCCDKNCGKAYHIECLKYWPQHKIQYEGNKIKSYCCPRHACHTCISPDVKSMLHVKESDKRLIKCILCPGTYHRQSECIPAGSELLSETQLICARHQSTKNQKRINIDFCILCSKGGKLICCDSCPNAFHQECLLIPVGDHFMCEVN